jgi:hypothetical protein
LLALRFQVLPWSLTYRPIDALRQRFLPPVRYIDAKSHLPALGTPYLLLMMMALVAVLEV